MATTFPPENLYAHTKKLRFIVEHVTRTLARKGRAVDLLDFGCGNGSAVSRFLMLDGVRYHGVDFHPDSLAYARSLFSRPGAEFTARVPDGIPFDVLVYADVLEHLDDPVAILREHAARSAPDALLIASVPNGYGAFENEKRLDRWLKFGAVLDLPARVRRNLRPRPPSAAPGPTAPYNDASGHVQFFTRRRLRRALAGAGFRLGELRNGAFVGAPLSERYLLRGERVARWNARAADFVPHWAAASWLFTAERDQRVGSGT